MAKNKEPKMKFKELVKKYEAEFERVEPLLNSDDKMTRLEAEHDLQRLSLDSGYDHRKLVVKAHRRRKFALIGSISSVLGSVLLALGAFYTLNLGAVTVPGMMILSTALVGGTAILGFGLTPLILSLSTRRKEKKLALVAKKSKQKYEDYLFAKQEAKYYNNVNTNANTNKNVETNVNGEELVLTENLDAINKQVKKNSKKANSSVSQNVANSFAYTEDAITKNQQKQSQQTSVEDIKEVEQESVSQNKQSTVNTVDEDSNNVSYEQEQGTDDEYSGKMRELTYEELAKEVQGWKFVMKDYKKNPKTKYKCRVELKQYGEKKSGPITSKVLNIVEDDITKFVEQLKNLCDKKSNANKLATARKLCKSAKSMGLKAELRLVMTDMNNPKKTLRTVYKNEEDFVASLETLGRQSAIDNMYYTLSTLNTQQLEVPKTYPTLENQDATQTKVDEQTNSDTTTPNSYVDISKDEIEFEF